MGMKNRIYSYSTIDKGKKNSLVYEKMQFQYFNGQGECVCVCLYMHVFLLRI
jgi:hypothetical protein